MGKIIESIKGLLPARRADAAPLKIIEKRLDGWVNALTSMGVVGKDKKMASLIEQIFLDQPTLDALYQADHIAARIVDKPAHEMMREGYRFTSQEIEAKDFELFHGEMEALNFDKKVEEAVKLSRLYGGAAILIGANSSNDDSFLKEQAPLDLTKINSIDYLLVLDRFELTNGTEIDTDVRSPNFGFPVYYSISSASLKPGETQKKIHHSRLLRFYGVELPRNMRRMFNYWGDSVLSRAYLAIRNFHTAHDTVPSIIQDFVNFILKMEDLPDIVSQGETGSDDLQKRLQLLSMTTSVLNAMIIRKEEDVEKKSTNVSGLGDLLKSVKENLLTAVDIPHTILFNESAGGLGSTGESERTAWYDHIKDMQESILRDKILWAAEVFRAAKTSVLNGTKGKITLEFNPLEQMDEKETAEIRKIQSETDGNYINNGVLDPIEVAESRFGTGQYSLETTIDMDLREKGDLPDSKEKDGGDKGAVKEKGKGSKGEGQGQLGGKSQAENNQVTAPEIALNGAQVTALVEVITQVALGQIPRETGVNMIQIAFAITKENAEKMMGTVGKGFTPKPLEDPSAKQ